MWVAISHLLTTTGAKSALCHMIKGLERFWQNHQQNFSKSPPAVTNKGLESFWQKVQQTAVLAIEEEIMAGFHVINHPLIQTKMAMLRSVETGTKAFREICGELATLICYEVTKDLPLVEVEVETPLCTTKCLTIDKKFAFVPILRAGLGMVDGLHRLIPTAKVGHIGLYRDPSTLKPVEYYCKLPPDICEREVFLLDPMLATGGTASMAIDYLKARHVKNIKLLVLVSCPVGVEKILSEHPEVGIYTACNDPELNDNGYIVPGLGDAGDRIFGTK